VVSVHVLCTVLGLLVFYLPVVSSNFCDFLVCYFRFETSDLLVHMYSDGTCVNVEFDKGGNSTVQHVVS
jgi:hypothetical protein